MIPVRKQLIRALIATCLGMVIVSAVLLTLLVHFVPIASTDIFLSREIQGVGGGPFLFLMKAISIWGDAGVSTITVVGAAIFFIAIQYQREALFVLLTFFTDALGVFLKEFVARPRPETPLVTVYQIIEGYSFPSGHVLHYVVFFGLLFVFMVVIKSLPFAVRVGIGTLSLFLILTISVSRVYLGSHWASDVIGGYLFGSLMLLALLWAYFGIVNRTG